MNDSAETSSDRDRKWKTALMVLSLEHAGPFWAEMGLELAETPTLRATALRAWEQLQALVESPSISAGDYEKDWQRTVAVALQEVDESSGPRARQILDDWVEFCFPWQDNQEARAIAWTSLWRRLQESDLSTLQLPLETKRALWQTIVEFVRWNEQFGKHFDATVPTHGSGSDLKIMVGYPEDCSPYDWVSAAVGYHYFQQTWAKLERLLNDEQLEELTRWLKTIAGQYRIKSSLLDRPRFASKRASRDSS